MESRSFANAHASHFRDSSRKLRIRRGVLLENIPRTLVERGSAFQPVEQTDEKQLAIDKNQAAVRNVLEKKIQIHDRSHVLAAINSYIFELPSDRWKSVIRFSFCRQQFRVEVAYPEEIVM